jgi:hypothetical protein
VSIDAHVPHTGWRRVWSVGRVLLVATAVIVVGGNLVRCMVQPAGGAADAGGASTGVGPEEAIVKPGAVAEVLTPERAAAEGVGRVFDFSFTDVSGRTRMLHEVAGEKATVVAVSSASCPLSRKWAPTLGDIIRRYQGKGVAFVIVNVGESDSEEAVDAQLKGAGIEGPTVTLVRTGGLEIARTMGAHATTGRFVLDGSRRMVYRGATDDQYGIGTAKPAPTVSWLRDALDAVLAGNAPKVSGTLSPGCILEYPHQPHAQGSVTWSGAAAIVYSRCVSCHHTGGIGPFALETYAQVKDHAPMIERVVSAGIMPPWLAAPPAEGHASQWANDKSLSAEEKETLLSWIARGMEAGDLAKAPKPPTFTSEWSIGAPDAVFELPEAVQVKAGGVMPYVNVFVPTKFTEDRWVSAVEVLPTARQAVHHVLVFAEDEGSEKKGPLQQRAERVREQGGFFAAYVPGGEAVSFPDGFAKKLPAHSTLHFQLHYTPTGEATTDRTRIGIRFAKEKPLHEVKVIAIAQPRLNIPAGEPDHLETAFIPVPADAVVTALMPHMHLRGKSFEYVWEKPGSSGDREVLLSVPRWDFNWQTPYRFKEPKVLPRGSRVVARARYDNSAENPSNPDPTRDVRWGQQSTDEMMIGYVEYYLK